MGVPCLGQVVLHKRLSAVYCLILSDEARHPFAKNSQTYARHTQNKRPKAANNKPHICRCRVRVRVKGRVRVGVRVRVRVWMSVKAKVKGKARGLAFFAVLPKAAKVLWASTTCDFKSVTSP
jgi:hypothetical protein